MKHTAFLMTQHRSVSRSLMKPGFLTQERVLQIKHLTQKMTAAASLTSMEVVVHHIVPTQLQKVTNLKIWH